MRKALGGRTWLAGIAGALFGALAQEMVNRIAGTTLITDGLMWGAVLAILGISLPNFARMGALTVNMKSSGTERRFSSTLDRSGSPMLSCPKRDQNQRSISTVS